MAVSLSNCHWDQVCGSILISVLKRFEKSEEKWLKMVIESNPSAVVIYNVQDSGSDCAASDSVDWACDCVKGFIDGNNNNEAKRKSWRVKLDCIVYCHLMKLLSDCSRFRNNVIEKLIHHPKLVATGLHYKCHIRGRIHLNFKILLCNDMPYFMDKSWNKRVESLIQERVELEEMMAYLSTLGGAFSQLADSSDGMRDTLRRHAATAGTISKYQFQIAIKIGDPTIVSRCKLFLALSLMQLGKIRRPKRIILEQYQFAKSLADNCRDIRLENMCIGSWVKLQHQAESSRKLKNRM